MENWTKRNMQGKNGKKKTQRLDGEKMQDKCEMETSMQLDLLLT